MTKREIMTTVRDWGALVGALAMVGFMTFVPQHASAPTDHASVRHTSATEWPSRTAEARLAEETPR